MKGKKSCRDRPLCGRPHPLCNRPRSPSWPSVLGRRCVRHSLLSWFARTLQAPSASAVLQPDTLWPCRLARACRGHAPFLLAGDAPIPGTRCIRLSATAATTRCGSIDGRSGGTLADVRRLVDATPRAMLLPSDRADDARILTRAASLRAASVAEEGGGRRRRSAM